MCNPIMGILALSLVLVVCAGCRGRCSRRRVLVSSQAPAAIGPYSQAVQAGKTVYLSGQIPIDPVTGEITAGTIEEQSEQVIANLSAVLAAGGMTLEHVVSTQVYMVDLEEFARMNTVYGNHFKVNPPARATVQVSRLPRNAKVEISAIAVK